MEIERMLLIMLHVGSFVAAAVGVAYADLSLFKGRRVDKRLLQWASQLVLWALVGLWVTGLAIIWIDTSFLLADILSRPKLMAKITVVILLTLNGYLLHKHFFEQIMAPTERYKRTVNFSAMLAAVSGASWMFAAFLGMAKPLGKIFAYSDFMMLYGTLLLMATIAVLAMVRPRIARLFRAEIQAIKAAQQAEQAQRQAHKTGQSGKSSRSSRERRRSNAPTGAATAVMAGDSERAAA